MNVEAAEIYGAGVQGMGQILTGFLEWAITYVDDPNHQAEALFHITQMADAFHNFTLAIADQEGLSL